MSNNKQPTAVEKLESFFRTHCNPSVCNIEWSDFNTAFLEAKAMHKEEMCEFAFKVGRGQDYDDKEVRELSEIIYNETFGGNNEQQ